MQMLSMEEQDRQFDVGDITGGSSRQIVKQQMPGVGVKCNKSSVFDQYL